MNYFMRNRLWMVFILCLTAACGSGTDVLPTLMDSTAMALNETATATAQIALLASQQPPTLPPTWTPSPEPTLPITDTPQPTSTPVVSQGNLYFIFNGDSVARLSADGVSEQLIVVGGVPSDLTLSPDGTLLAYTRQGSGSAREVFVSSVDGTYTQQVSCLGFARALSPTWQPDGQALIFAASQTPDGALGVYVAGVVGSGQCPAGNNQRLVAQLDKTSIGNFTWNADGSRVFFDSELIYGIDMTTETLYPPLTQSMGWGPDYIPSHSPRDPLLLYIKSQRDQRQDRNVGVVFQMETDEIGTPPLLEMRSIPLEALSLPWSKDGLWLGIATQREVWVQNRRTNNSTLVVENANFFPQPVFSPDGAFVAYVDGGQDNIAIPQVFTVRNDGFGQMQLTRHQEGTISDLNWGTS